MKCFQHHLKFNIPFQSVGIEAELAQPHPATLRLQMVPPPPGHVPPSNCRRYLHRRDTTADGTSTAGTRATLRLQTVPPPPGHVLPSDCRRYLHRRDTCHAPTADGTYTAGTRATLRLQTVSPPPGHVPRSDCRRYLHRRDTCHPPTADGTSTAGTRTTLRLQTVPPPPGLDISISCIGSACDPGGSICHNDPGSRSPRLGGYCQTVGGCSASQRSRQRGPIDPTWPLEQSARELAQYVQSRTKVSGTTRYFRTASS